MGLKNTKTGAKAAVAESAASSSRGGVKTSFGMLPEWNLNDLFDGTESEAFRTTFERSVPDSADFEARYKGKLGGYAKSDPTSLAQAISDFEALEDSLGRLISYSGLLYAGD